MFQRFKVRNGPLAGWTQIAEHAFERYDGLTIVLDSHGWRIAPPEVWRRVATPALLEIGSDTPTGKLETRYEAAAVADHKFPPRECYACNSLATGLRSDPPMLDEEIVPPAKPTEDLPKTLDGKRWVFACAQHCDGGTPDAAPEPDTDTRPFVAEWIDSKGKVVAYGTGDTADEAETEAARRFEPVRLKRRTETFRQEIRRHAGASE